MKGSKSNPTLNMGRASVGKPNLSMGKASIGKGKNSASKGKFSTTVIEKPVATKRRSYLTTFENFINIPSENIRLKQEGKKSLSKPLSAFESQRPLIRRKAYFNVTSSKKDSHLVYKSTNIFRSYELKEPLLDKLLEKEAKNKEEVLSYCDIEYDDIDEIRKMEEENLLQIKNKADYLVNEASEISKRNHEKYLLLSEGKALTQRAIRLGIQFRHKLKENVIMKTKIRQEVNKGFYCIREALGIEHINSLKKEIYTTNREIEKSIELIGSLKKKDVYLDFEITQNNEKLNNLKARENEVTQVVQGQSEKFNLLENSMQGTIKECCKMKEKINYLFQRIGFLKGVPLVFCVVVPKTITESIFNYEAFMKQQKGMKICSLIYNEKFQRLGAKTCYKTPTKFPIDTSNKKYLSESEKKPKKLSCSKWTRNQNQYKFDAIIEQTDSQHDVFASLVERISIFIKSTIYRSWENLFKNISFDDKTIEMTYDFEFSEMSEFSLEDLHKHMAYLGLWGSEINPEALHEEQSNIYILGDKHRGVCMRIVNYVENLFKTAKSWIFEVTSIKYSLCYLERDKLEERITAVDFIEFIQIFENIEFVNTLYQESIEISIDINFKVKNLNNSLEHRKINIYLLNCSDQEDEDIFRKNLFSFFEYKEKQFLSCDLLFQRLKKRVFGYERSMILAEIPNVIKLNSQSYYKFEKIKRIFEIIDKF